MVAVMQCFPQLTPWNVWDLPWFAWVGVRAVVDHKLEEAARG